MKNRRNRNIDMIAADEDRLESVRDNIDAAENEYAKYADMITDKKNKSLKELLEKIVICS